MAKQVDDREKSTRAVVAAIEEHSAAIDASLREALSPYAKELDGKSVPDVARLLKLIGLLLADRSQSLVTASLAHEAEARDDAEPRERRDAAEVAVRARVTGLRLNVQGTYGGAGLSALGLSEPVPTAPDPLKNYAIALLQALAKPGAPLVPLHPGEGFELQPSKAAAGLKPSVDALAAALGDVAREKAELDTTQVAKNAALGQNDQDFIRFVGLVEALARAVGLVELADRVRPSGRQPGVLADLPTPAEDVPTPTGGVATPKPAAEPGMPGSSPFRE